MWQTISRTARFAASFPPESTSPFERSSPGWRDTFYPRLTPPGIAASPKTTTSTAWGSYCLGQRGPARTGCRQPYVLAADAEALVEDLYRRIQLPPSRVSRLTEELEAEIVERQAEASERRVVLTKTLAKLAEERGKLLQAFYARLSRSPLNFRGGPSTWLRNPNTRL